MTRKIKMAMYVSIDGVYENPVWTLPFWNDELAVLQKEFLFSSDALLLGRITYEGFAAAWPTMTDNDGFASRMNAMPKYVASQTLTDVEWNATLLKGDIGTEVAKLKAWRGRDLLINGSGQLVSTLTRLGLIDHFRLMVHPVVVGGGTHLFDGLTVTTMRLTNTQTTATGVVVLDYEPATKT